PVALRIEPPASADTGGPAPAALPARLQALALQPFDLTRPPLLRAHLLPVSVEHHVLLLVLHHIVSDGWSMGVMLRELSALYAADGDAAALLPLPVQYADFALWQ